MAAIRTVAVIGAGTPGRAIALLSARGGFHTILEDVLPSSLRQAESEIGRALDHSVESGGLDRSAANTALARIEYAASIEQAARAADLVIEAVPDELESKLEILILLDKVARPATIVASTTASLPVAELASATYRANRILGMRFSTSGDGHGLLEIVRTAETDEETVTACVAAGSKMCSRVVVTEEARSGEALPGGA